MVVICEIKRTAIGKFLGMFSNVAAPELCSHVVKDVCCSLDRSEIDEVILGNVLQAGVGQNPARQASILSGLPNSIPCNTINKVCGSGLNAVILGCQAIKAGDSSVVICGGMENMSKAPHVVNLREIKKLGNISKDEFCSDKEKNVLIDSLVHEGLWCAFNSCYMGVLTEKIVKKYKINRSMQDSFALNSHKKAAKAISNGSFVNEIVAVEGKKEDEGPRKDTSMEKLSKLPGVFGGSITAGNSSSLNDGASVAVIASKKKARELGLNVLAEIEAYSSSSVDPKNFPIAPVSGVKKLLKESGRKIGDFDLIELNEAFSGQSLAVVNDLGIADDVLNVNGGAIALGHPIGASGCRILCTLVHAMHKRKKDLGLATLCIGGGESVSMSVKII